MRNRRLILAVLGLFGLLLYTAGCDSADNPIAPSGSVLTITANPTQINLNGQSSTITIVGFKPDGNPLNPGTQINLSTTLGVLAQTLVEVTSGGRATTTLAGDGRPGTATITATLPGGGETSATVDVLIGETPDTQETLSITATPNRINIEQESTISVIARNSDGSRAANQPVTLRTSLGQLGRELLTTDGNGEASTVLRPDGRSGTAEVTGSVGSGMETMAQVTILQTAVTVTVSPRIVDIGDTATITVLVRDEDNIPLREGHEVQLTANLGTLNPSDLLTDGNGAATSVYTAGTRAGNDTITAFVGNSAPATGTIDVRSAPAAITLVVSPTSTIPPNQDTQLAFIATVTDAEGLLLPNEVVQFTVEGGIPVVFNPSSSVSTDNGGRATTNITFELSGVQSPPSQVRVSATARNITVPAQVTVFVQ